MTDKKQDEFYIGWVGKTPPTFAALTKRFVLVLLPVIILLGVLLAVSQKKFGTGNFEFGTLTEVRGIYFDKPVPNLRVVTGFGLEGNNSFVTIPLIGYGKFGADGAISDIEKAKHAVLNGKWITLKGTLLYNDGKALMQVDIGDNPITNIADVTPHPMTVDSEQLGSITVKGEIIDPKCYFGVMKPGEGKPHEDCAIRCILGGMPPMLHVVDGSGRINYYFIVGHDGGKINNSIKNYIAGPVAITGKAIQYGDWVVLYTDGPQSITAISKSALWQPKGSIMACAAGGTPLKTPTCSVR